MSEQDEAVDVGLAHKTTSAFREGVETVRYLLTLGTSKWASDMSAPR